MTRLQVTPRLSVKVLSALFLLLVSLITLSAHATGSSTLVISQVYGGGGNTGAVISNDYVEILNIGTTAIDMSGYSVQYSSATGTTISGTSGITVLSGTLQPKHYYLVQEAVGANTTAGFPVTPDATGTIAMSSTAGKVFLVHSTAAMTSSNICADSNLVDFVGFGPTASCAEGSPTSSTDATAVLSNTTYAQRKNNGCTDTDDNANDFTVLTLATTSMHDMASAAAVCGVAAPTATGVATPASQVQGASTLLTVTVVPGSGTGIAVTADLSAFGGSTTQTLYDDGTHGDATSGDSVYSYSLTIPSAQAVNSYTISAKVTDTQLDSIPTVSIPLTVQLYVPITAIHTIQGTPPTVSTYIGQSVNITGIVTGIRSTGFYLQAKDSDADSNAATPEAIYVNTGTTPPASVVVGNNLQVTGVVTSPITATGYLAAPLEIDSPTGYSVLSTGNTLPTAITLSATTLSPTGSTTQLLQYQSMLMTAPTMTSTSGTTGTLNESTETYTSDGKFYAALPGVARPFRAVGADTRDAAPTGGAPSAWTRYTAPTNLLQVATGALTSTTAVDLVTGSTITPATGVLDYSAGTPLLMLNSAPVVVQGSPSTTATTATASQLSVATLEMQRFYDTETGVAGANTLTSADYARRLRKASYAIRNSMGMPDVIALQEVESATELTALSAQISSDATAASQTDPAYVGTMGAVGPNGYGNAILTKPAKVSISGSGNFGVGVASYYYIDPTTNTHVAIWDTPPVYVNLGVKRGTGATYQTYVISAELLPTANINSNTVVGSSTAGAKVRAQRLAQAQQLAGTVDTGFGTVPIILGCNCNAYEFSDGYVDVTGILTKTQAAANTVVLSNTNTYNSLLTDLVPALAAGTRYTANESGVASSLDHIMVNSNVPTGTTIQAVHIDSDYNVIYRNDSSTALLTTPYRTSDRDALVAIMQVPALPTTVTLNPTSLTFSSQAVGTSAQKTFTITSTAALTISSIVASGSAFSQTSNCPLSPAVLAANTPCTVTVTFAPTVAGTPTGSVVVTDSDSTGTQTVTLTGTAYNLTATNTTLTAVPAAPVFGQSVVLTATIPGNGTVVPTGTVAFKDGATTLTSAAALTGGTSASTATYTATGLTATTHSLTAIYSGDSTFATSTGSLSLVVSPVTSATSVFITPASSTVGVSVTFTASVTSNLGTPGGTVQFYDGSATTGPAQTLVSGTATYTTSALTQGTHSITAVYSGATGTTIYPGSTSTAATITVGAALVPDFSMTLANTQLIVGGSLKSASTAVSIFSINGFNSTVSFSCSGLPASASCSFSPATVTPSGYGTTTLTIVTSAAANHAPHFGFGNHTSPLVFAFTLLLAPLAFRKRKSAVRLLTLGLLLIAGMSALTGCGSGGTPSGTSAVTVSAVSASGVTHTATISLVTQ